MAIFRKWLILAAFVLALSSAGGVPPIAPVGGGVGFAIDCSTTTAKATPFEKYGPHYSIKSDPKVLGKTKISERKNLKVMSYNMENLVESPGKYVEIDGKHVWQYGKLEKSADRLEAVLRNIRSENPDVIVGIEIESLDAMQKAGLEQDYYAILVPGNDERGINIGFFVKKDLAVDIDIQSHREMRHLYMGQETKLFSRDFPVLQFRDPGAAAESDPIFILGGVHLKSQRAGDPGSLGATDVNSVAKRTAQADAMAAVMAEYDAQYGSRVPIFMAGDFNNDVRYGKEFAEVRKKFRDAFDVKGVPQQSIDRTTQSYFPRANPNFPNAVPKPKYSQLDGFFVSKAGTQKVQEIHVVKELDASGRPMDPPKSFEERETRGSDHRALSVTLNFGG
ncbi:MAG: hypothetical protein JST04_10930 [Bdellovibrionales bacterium]|nr:hypothetical protein [Bdellovibrionales bacterium]